LSNLFSSFSTFFSYFHRSFDSSSASLVDVTCSFA